MCSLLRKKFKKNTIDDKVLNYCNSISMYNFVFVTVVRLPPINSTGIQYIRVIIVLDMVKYKEMYNTSEVTIHLL